MSGAIRGRALLAAAVSAVVALAIVAGFMASGSPKSARAERLDDQRVQQLVEIDRAIDAYFRKYRELPATLDEVQDRSTYPLIIEDPETKTRYEYRAVGDREYELCATFARIVEASEMEQWERKWAHGAGHHCFDRTVDRLP